MKLSYNKLREHINIDFTPEQASEILTQTGLEVEGVEQTESIKGGLKGIVIGKVLTKEKHTGADKLSVTTVDIGNNVILPIVCGAPNVEAGQTVVVATVGTTLYSGDESFKIKKAKIRGEVSEGMICAEDEIGIGTSHAGIMVLPDEVAPGIPADEYFKVEKDTVFEIGLTPNRIDGASHIGAARDIVAYFKSQNKNAQLILPDVSNFKIDNNNTPVDIKIENNEACKRYTGITMTNVKVGDSPEWLQNKLKAIGLSPINNIVDISNYVLHETGHPLHIFDLDEVTGKEVIIKTMPNKTPFTTLDGETRELSDNDLMICNTNEPMCIAGVFGGEKSGVKEQTTSIFIESALFDSVWIRKTAKRHNLNTDASFRFERGADIENTVYALKRAALLIKELAGGEISSEIIDIYPEKHQNNIVEIKYSYIWRLIGKDIDKETIETILDALDIKCINKTDEVMELEIPSYRVDVTRPADVVEEILRIYGYNNIETGNRVNGALSFTSKIEIDYFRNNIADFLSAQGFHEIWSNSLSNAEYEKENNNTVKIFNPLSNDLGIMRHKLLYGGLESVSRNINRRRTNLKLYEFGNVYAFNPESENENPLKAYSEKEKLSLWITGNTSPENRLRKDDKTDFYTIKSYVSNILQRIGIDEKYLTKTDCTDIFDYGLKYLNKDKEILKIGAVKLSIREQLDIEQDVFYAVFDVKALHKAAEKNNIEFIEPAKFPEVRRDLALVLDEEILFENIKNAALKAEKKLIKHVDIFDVYQGDKIEQGKKSYALKFILQDSGKTLNDKQIDKTMKKLTNLFETEFNAQIRQ